MDILVDNIGLGAKNPIRQSKPLVWNSPNGCIDVEIYGSRAN
jgi:hypothetical protein